MYKPNDEATILKPLSRDRHFPAFHVVAKPVGSLCNLDCSYCYYLEKERLYAGEKFRMDSAVLESFVKQYIAGQQIEDVHFLWQGGEPTLLGLEYFQRIVELQRTNAGGKRIHNALQTNGFYLNEAWCKFLRENEFLVGISIDGPAHLHDPYRVTKGGAPTHAKVLAAIELLRKHDVAFNAMIVVHPVNVGHPIEVYSFLKDCGVRHMQFAPIVERWIPESNQALAPADRTDTAVVTPWSVNAEAYGQFLIAIFDHWLKADVGKVFVQIFDTALESWMGLEPSLCVFRKECGNALAVERNGDVYACDHYVFPQFRRGNLQHEPLVQLLESPPQRAFGQNKNDSLPSQCRKCDVLFACRGECPKNRFITTDAGEPGLNYLCPAYLAFFRHIDAPMQKLAAVVQAQLATSSPIDQ